MKIKIEINTDNAAFQPDPIEEVRRILKESMDEFLVSYATKKHLRDINGNFVGTITKTK